MSRRLATGPLLSDALYFLTLGACLDEGLDERFNIAPLPEGLLAKSVLDRMAPV